MMSARMTERGLVLVLAVTAFQALAWDPPKRNGEVPGPLFQQHLNAVKAEIAGRQNDVLFDMVESAKSSEVYSQGSFVLSHENFAVLDQAPVISEARLWSESAQAFDKPAALTFSTFELHNSVSSVADATIEQMDDYLRYWQGQAFNYIEVAAMDEQLYLQLSDFYTAMRRFIAGNVTLLQQDRPFLTVAFYKAEGLRAKPKPVAMALSVVNEGNEKATVEYLVSNPQAQLRRKLRPDGTVGNVGESLMDHEFRRLRSFKVQRIELEAENNRVSRFARARGFKQSC